MEYGVHLPLIDFSGNGYSLAELKAFAQRASDLGYKFLCANDHLLFNQPWLDGPTALAAVLEESGTMKLATTVSIPVVRGPIPMAKMLAAIDLLSAGRLVVCLGPGSSERDYRAVGVPFQERWKRFEEVMPTLRSLLEPDNEPFRAAFYSTQDIQLEPRPRRSGGPQLWIGSWGSEAGLRRVARHGDGWLASAYNTTPQVFEEGLAYLSTQLERSGKEPQSFPNGISTMWLYITEDQATSERMLSTVLSPALNRSVEELQERLPFGAPEECAKKLKGYAAAGAQRIFLWPLGDELQQLKLFMEKVAPLVDEVGP